jgi:hypothetical protein
VLQVKIGQRVRSDNGERREREENHSSATCAWNTCNVLPWANHCTADGAAACVRAAGLTARIGWAPTRDGQNAAVIRVLHMRYEIMYFINHVDLQNM